ncbi:MAG: SAM-dependent methyltransferase [Candidatus Micrarchaeota archaeon]
MKTKKTTKKQTGKAARVIYCKDKTGSITYTTDGKFLYAQIDNGGEIRLDLFDNHYYKLRIYNEIPILEIDGLRMQLVKGFKTPLEYAEKVVAGLSIPSNGQHVILDTCMGLGYTAIQAAKSPGISTVLTCEIAEAVFTLAKWNPLSDGLWENGTKILPIHGDVAELIKTFDSRMFSFVIHDPPRFSHAPQLYSSDFYKELHRVCKSNAKIFHYVGSVGKGKGRNIEKEVAGRLSNVGFKKIKYVSKLQGLFFSK